MGRSDLSEDDCEHCRRVYRRRLVGWKEATERAEAEVARLRKRMCDALELLERREDTPGRPIGLAIAILRGEGRTMARCLVCGHKLYECGCTSSEWREEIQDLRAENERLREVLRQLADEIGASGIPHKLYSRWVRIARAALDGEGLSK